MTHSKTLGDDVFATVIRYTPLVSVDLVVMSPDGRALLGRRRNEPARNSWFVFGGRIFKDERIADAMRRISRAELGLALDPAEARLLGAFEHLYDSNCFGDDAFGTHYVVLAHRWVLTEALPVVTDAQHDAHRWWTVPELLEAPDVHPYTKAYFSD